MIIQTNLLTSLPPVKNKVIRFFRRVHALPAATEVVLLLKSGGNEVICPTKRRCTVQLSSSASSHEHMILPVPRLLSEKIQDFTGDPVKRNRKQFFKCMTL
jgi:hypothetical protein